MRSRITLLLVAGLVAGAFTIIPANAQGPTPADLDRMLSSVPPEQMKLMPYYKWGNGAPIEVLVVTGKQRGVCVDLAMERLTREVELIRDVVPELRGMRAPRPIDWIPETKLQAPLLIGLEMPHPRIEEAMKWYANFNKPRARLWDEDRSTNILSDGDGFSVESQLIVQAYHWAQSSKGLRYSEETCRRSIWEIGVLNGALGGKWFRVINSRWIQDMPDTPQRDGWWNLMDRLFLKALYACPSSPAALECIKPALNRLVNDPALVPWR